MTYHNNRVQWSSYDAIFFVESAKTLLKMYNMWHFEICFLKFSIHNLKQ